jgi:hypothetical protein
MIVPMGSQFLSQALCSARERKRDKFACGTARLLRRYFRRWKAIPKLSGLNLSVFLYV